ncbi:spore coat U domain-containing protein [Achromobacter sp. UMC71]|uniref:Csu type fimbrial protein n=1 Tax=Achromobacter sp. UMC71 TaxID=1862320 RepID=UPI0016033FFC|nr:spore coat U domain-containing protein [Achromobacter sp. UMC71]MBB1625372.1 pilus assembly protein [Achromobacter sp. UMC71]
MKSALFLLGALLGLGWSADAQATTCALASGTTSTVNFGTVNPLLAADTFADSNTVTVTCNFTSLALGARLCFSAGVGNTSPSVEARAMGAGAFRMNYNLYTDSGHNQIWSTSAANTTTSVLVTGPLLTGGLGSGSFSFYAKLPGNQSTVSTIGNANTLYSENYTTTVRVDIASGLLATLLVNCPITTPMQTLFVPLTVQATVQKNCTINATNLAFPAQGLLNHVVTANGQITVRCTNNNAFSVALSGGSVANNVAARKMKHATAADTVSYQLYQDGGYATIWGDGLTGGTPLTGTGTGANQQFTVYGRVPVQATPRPGNYTDTVIATITF